jgi:hypothetical protein
MHGSQAIITREVSLGNYPTFAHNQNVNYSANCTFMIFIVHDVNIQCIEAKITQHTINFTELSFQFAIAAIDSCVKKRV